MDYKIIIALISEFNSSFSFLINFSYTTSTELIKVKIKLIHYSYFKRINFACYFYNSPYFQVFPLYFRVN